MGTRKGGERSSPLCLSCLLKLQPKATNNRGKRGGATPRNCSPRKKQEEEKEAKKEGEKGRNEGKEKEERKKKKAVERIEL